MSRPNVQVCLALAIVSCSNFACGGLVALHSGNADPTAEGWNAAPGSGGGVSVGAINDGGIDAWFVDDNSTALNSIFFYAHATHRYRNL